MFQRHPRRCKDFLGECKVFNSTGNNSTKLKTLFKSRGFFSSLSKGDFLYLQSILYMCYVSVYFNNFNIASEQCQPFSWLTVQSNKCQVHPGTEASCCCAVSQESLSADDGHVVQIQLRSIRCLHFRLIATFQKIQQKKYDY